LTEEELDLVARVRDTYRALAPIPCTNCQYCQPCPSGVNIPRIFEVYNDAIMYGDERAAREAYQWVEEEQRGELCVECRECLEKCPQQIDIPEWLAKANRLLSPDEPE
jgi:predicted aldo/keto reductase-like oxidoreductase